LKLKNLNKMKSHIKIYNIPFGTDEWYEFRKRGIGGSEIATVLGINKYDTAVRLYHEKIGTIEPIKEDNERTFWGRYQEDAIAKIWQYYDGTKDGYIENFKNNKIIRNCRSVNGFIVNPNYPWLFGEVDRLINIKGGINLITGKPLENEGILECKNMGYWMSKVWEDGIPIYFLAQIHQYMAILETDYAEIAILVDGSNLIVEKIQRDDILIDKILSISKSWWYDRVMPARTAKQMRDIAEIKGDIEEAERQDTIIQNLEPEPDSSEAYKDFMEDRFLVTRTPMQGNIHLYSLARKDNFYKAIRNRIDEERNFIKNQFINIMTKNQVDTIEFEGLGSVNWSEKKGSQSRIFNNRVKERPSQEVVEREFSKLDFNSF